MIKRIINGKQDNPATESQLATVLIDKVDLDGTVQNFTWDKLGDYASVKILVSPAIDCISGSRIASFQLRGMKDGVSISGNYTFSYTALTGASTTGSNAINQTTFYNASSEPRSLEIDVYGFSNTNISADLVFAMRGIKTEGTNNCATYFSSGHLDVSANNIYYVNGIYLYLLDTSFRGRITITGVKK